MKIVSIEKFIEQVNCDVYPVTIMKFLLNRRRILSYLTKVANKNPKVEDQILKVDSENCEKCKAKKDLGILCRQHTSVQRVLEADNVAFDYDTSIYFYKNEIFKEVDDNLVIFYCPHTKLIRGKINDLKVRKIDALIVPKSIYTEFPNFKSEYKFVTSGFMESNMMSWFNDEFSIVTLPGDISKCNWCLIPNH